MRSPRSVAHTLAAAALACAVAVPAAEEATVELDTAPTAELMAADLIVMRPLGLVGTVLGTGIYIVALPFNALTLNFKDPARRLILEPAQYTFTRKLGDLE